VVSGWSPIRVVEFTHMVMGPTCGLILADLGADVIKVEPLEGDSTRRLLGSGAGFFALFNRNKRSLAVDVKDPRGREIVLRLVAGPMSSARTSSRHDGPAGPGRRLRCSAEPAADPRARTRASCPAPTNTAPRWTRWCR
jgi:hypothetical protein